MLSCTCLDEYDPDSCSWWFFSPTDMKPYPKDRRKRCSSCGVMVGKGDPCLEFPRGRGPRSDVEEDIYGDEIPLAPMFFCERCAEIYLNLSDIGYCFTPTDNMKEALEEYWELTGFVPMRTAR